MTEDLIPLMRRSRMVRQHRARRKKPRPIKAGRDKDQLVLYQAQNTTRDLQDEALRNRQNAIERRYTERMRRIREEELRGV